MNRIKKSLLFILLFLGVTAHLSLAGEILTNEYVCRDLDGVDRWHASVEITNKSDNIFTIVEKVEGYSSVFDAKVSWTAKMDYMESEDIIRPLNLRKQVFDEKGMMIRQEKQDFDFDNNIVVCSHEDFQKDISIVKQFRIEKDIVNRLLLSFYIQKLLNNGKTGGSVQMVSEEPNIYNIDIVNEGIETLEINGKKLKAYKMTIDPNLGVLNFVKVFVPKSYSWYSADKGSEWLKFYGLEGGIKTDEVEITKIY